MTSLDFDPPYVFSQRGTFAAPFEFNVPGSLAIRPDTAHATFDGTGAAGPFLACLTFMDSSGNRIARMFNPNAVAAGDVAEVTFVPPFGSASSSSGTNTGDIRFDFDNEGGWLDITTNNTDHLGYGLNLVDASGGGVLITDTAGGGITLQDFGGGGLALETDQSSPMTLQDFGGGGIFVTETQATGGITLQDEGGGGITLRETGTGKIEVVTHGGGELNISDTGGGGVNVLSASGSAGATLAATTQNPIAFPPASSTPVIIVADGTSGAPAIVVGVDSADWVSIFDRNNNNASTVFERFRFFATGHCEMLNLPTSSAGLPAGSLWNNSGVVNIV